MRHAIVPGLLLLFTILAGCSDSDSGSSSETVDLFLLDDVAGQTHRMEEQRTYRLRIFGGSYENSAVTSWQWREQPVEAGAFSACRDQQNFDVQLAAGNLQNACTASANCSLSFDQVSSADTDSDGLSVFTVKVPVLKAPVGVKYRVEGTHEGGQVVASNHTFCLVSINEPPLAADDAYTVTEGVERVVGQVGGNLLTNDADDIDESNQTLTVTLVSPPSLSANFSLGTDGTFTYLYTGDLAGGQILQDSFQYQISDGFNSDTATVNLTIVTSDKPPELVNPIPAVSVESGVPLSIDLSSAFVDPEGGDLFFSILDINELPPSGNITLTPTGELAGTPSSADSGTYTVTILVTDQISTIEAPLVLTITENFPPSASELADVSVDFGELISIDASTAFTDPEGVDLTYRLLSSPVSALSINSETGLITGQIAADGVYEVTVFASDGINPEVSSTFSLTQLPIPNRAPVLQAEISNQTIELGEAITTIRPDFFDPDGDTLSYQITSEIPGLTFSTTTGVLSGTPSELLSLSINIIASDPDGLTANSNAFQITVSEVPNQPPTFSTDIASQAGNVGLSISPISGSFSDPEGESLVYSVSSLPAGLTIDPATGIISGTPSQTFSDTVTITATDPDGESVASNPFSLVVNPPLNSVPVLNSQIANISILVDDSASIATPASAFSDPDDDPLTFSLASNSGALPPGMALGASGVISGTPSQVGVFGGIVVQATDGSEATASNAFTITVSEQPNSRPVFSGPIPDVTRTVDEPTSVTTIAGQFSDPDQDNLVFSLASTSGDLPDGMTLSSDGVISGTPDDIGTSDGIIVVASDGELTVASNAFSITISPVPNTAPEFDSALPNLSATVGTAVSVLSIPTSFSDADDDPLTFSLAGNSSELPPGLVLNPSGTITGTPTADGTYSGIRVQASDGSETVVSNPFSIVVAEAPNSPPEFTGELVDPAGTEGVAFSLTTVAAQFSDDDDDPLTFSLAADSDELPPGLSISSNGSITGTPTLAGTYSGILVSASDGEEAVVSPAFSIVISPAPNSVPEFSGQIPNATATVGQLFTLNTIAQRFSDDDDDELTFSLTNNSGDLPPGLTLSSTGEISGTPTADGVFAAIRISASDGSAQVVANPFRITVAEAPNTAPEFTGVISDVAGTVDVELNITTIPAQFSDDDNDLLTYSLASTSAALPTGFSLSTTGVLSGSTSAEVSVSGIIVQASDGSATAVSNAFDLSIEPEPNSAPEFSGNIIDVVGSVDTLITVTTIPTGFSDADGDDLTFSLAAASADLPTGFSLTAAGVLSGESSDPVSVEDLIIEASDGSGSAFSNPFSLTVSALPNSPPVFTGSVAAINLEQGESASVNVVSGFSDADEDTLVYSLAVDSEELPDALSLDEDTGIISGTPAASGTTSGIIVSASDGSAAATTNPFSITVAGPANTPPEFTGNIVNQVGSFDVLLSIDVVASEFTDTDSLTFTLAPTSGDLPDGLELDPVTGEISGTPSAAGNFTGISIEASDGEAEAESNEFDFLINTPPEFAGPVTDQSAAEQEPLALALGTFFSDPDNDVLTFSLSTTSSELPLGLDLDPASGEIAGTPTVPGIVEDIQIEASDGVDSVVSNFFDIEIEGVVANSEPEFDGSLPATFSGTANDEFLISTIGLAFSDPDAGDTLTFALALTSGDLPIGLELDPDSGDIFGVPLNFGIATGIIIEASDGLASVQSSAFDIIIEPQA